MYMYVRVRRIVDDVINPISCVLKIKKNGHKMDLFAIAKSGCAVWNTQIEKKICVKFFFVFGSPRTTKFCPTNALIEVLMPIRIEHVYAIFPSGYSFN